MVSRKFIQVAVASGEPAQESKGSVRRDCKHPGVGKVSVTQMHWQNGTAARASQDFGVTSEVVSMLGPSAPSKIRPWHPEKPVGSHRRGVWQNQRAMPSRPWSSGPFCAVLLVCSAGSYNFCPTWSVWSVMSASDASSKSPAALICSESFEPGHWRVKGNSPDTPEWWEVLGPEQDIATGWLRSWDGFEGFRVGH